MIRKNRFYMTRGSRLMKILIFKSTDNILCITPILNSESLLIFWGFIHNSTIIAFVSICYHHYNRWMFHITKRKYKFILGKFLAWKKRLLQQLRPKTHQPFCQTSIHAQKPFADRTFAHAKLFKANGDAYSGRHTKGLWSWHWRKHWGQKKILSNQTMFGRKPNFKRHGFWIKCPIHV